MDLHELIDGLPIEAVAAPAGVRVGDLTEDSRTVLPGSMFIARPGLSSDGRRYINQAIDDGAVAILTDPETARSLVAAGVAVLASDDLPLACALLAERFFGNPSAGLRLAGVTGTNGKTTVAHMVHGLLNAAGHRCGLIGTVTIDDGREVAHAEMTTLPAIELSRTLASMVEHGCTCAVMEVSSHALDQRRAAGLSFDAGVFTTLGSDHLDYHGTLESYAAAKARLFELLPESAVAIVNADDPAHERMLERCRSGVVRCSKSAGDATVRITERSIDGITVAIEGPFGSLAADVPMTGDHNAMNLLQAACVAHALGASGQELRASIGSATPPPGRLEPVRVADESDISVFVDFAHTPDALQSTLSALRESIRVSARRGRLCVVFGCGGDRDTTKRPVMGDIAARLADRVVLTSDNPRSERPSEIISQIIAGMPPAGREAVLVHAERERAIEAAIVDAQPGDVVVIAGKGHERRQISAEGVRAFDDRQQAADALRRRAEALAGAPGSAAGTAAHA